MHAETTLITRRQFLDKLGISDSTERRKRQSEQHWPPHLLIGRKIYYRFSTVEEYLRQSEKARVSGPVDGDSEAPRDTVGTPSPAVASSTSGPFLSQGHAAGPAQ